MTGEFSGDFSNQTFPEVSSDEKEAEARKEESLREHIGSRLDTAADEAENRIRNNPNIAAFGPDSLQESVSYYRDEAMFTEAKSIVTSLFGEVVSSFNMTEEQKANILDLAVINIVGKHKDSKKDPNQGPASLFKE